MRNKAITSVLIIGIILIADQLIKIWVKTSMDYSDPSIPLLGNWLKLAYVENQGMAFGATLGGASWAKLVLSIFRVFAIGAIIYYLVQQIRLNARFEFIIVISIVLAGATGNLLDSMFYDFFFTFDPCLSFNQLEGSGIWGECEYYGFKEDVELRRTGFLYGNVVDMFYFDVNWPEWVPKLAGKQVFPAVWNLADGAISVGVIMVLIRQKKYFSKKS